MKNKSLLLAGVMVMGLAAPAIAQQSPEQGVEVPATSPSQASTDNASAAAQALPDQGTEPDNRPNTAYGTLEPGAADTTRDSVPSTTRNADSTETRAPLAGANSFTQAEAMRRIQSQGYTQVSGLAKDDQSVWRGTAVKGGTPVTVALDYRGNVTDSAK